MPPPPPPDRERTLLLVDDTQAIRELLRIFFELEPGVVVLEAEDGVEALALAHAHRPDVVVLDWQMPRLDGIATARRLTAELPGTRIVMYSSRIGSDAERTALAAGAHRYLEKGMDIAEVVAEIKRHLRSDDGRPAGEVAE